MVLNHLYLVRGCPGSGKSTVAANMAKAMGGYHFEADQLFTDAQGVYKFVPKLIGVAHAKCQEKARNQMKLGTGPVVVSNTFTTESEMKPYIDMAAEYGYMVFSIIVENRHGNKDVHNVPVDVLDVMEKRFQVKLR